MHFSFNAPREIFISNLDRFGLIYELISNGLSPAALSLRSPLKEKYGPVEKLRGNGLNFEGERKFTTTYTHVQEKRREA